MNQRKLSRAGEVVVDVSMSLDGFVAGPDDGKKLPLGGTGASAAQQALRAGLVDRIHLHIAPILLGAGVRLFDRLGDDCIALRKLEVIDADDVTHVNYEVLK